MNKRFIAVPPTEIDSVWFKIEDGLNKIERPGGFTNDNIYAEIAAGRSILFLLSVDGKESGFVVLQEAKDFGVPRLHIWLCYSNKNQNILSVFDPEITDIAHRMGASRISFSSSLAFWQRVAPKHGFHPRETLYTRPVVPKE